MRWAGFFSVLIVALALRVPHLPGLWVDEVYSVEAARTPLGAILARVDSDVHPPLWNLVLGVSVRLFGDGDAAVRIPSVVFACATVLVLLRVTRDWFPERARALPAALLALSVAHIHYAREARGYALMELISLVGCWLAVEHAMSPGARLLAAWLACAVALCWTHYVGFLMVFLQGLLLFAATPSRRVIGAGALVVLGTAPLLTHLARNAGRGIWWLRPPQPVELLLLPADLVWAPWHDARALAFGLPLGLVLWAVVLSRLAMDRDPRFRMWSALWILPSIAAMAISLTLTPIWNLRQLLFIQPALLVSLSWIAATSRSRLPALALLACAAAAVPYFDDQHKNTDKQVAGYLAGLPRDAAVLVWPGYQKKALAHYLREPVPSASQGRREDRSRAERNPGSTWLVWYRALPDESGKDWADGAPPELPPPAFTAREVAVYRLR